MQKKLFVLSIILILLSACSAVEGIVGGDSSPNAGGLTNPEPVATVDPTTDPEGVARTFLSAWESGDYAGMYSHLSPNSQATYTLEQFTDIYTSASSTMTLITLEATPLSALKTDTTAQLVFTVRYTTSVLGEIEEELTMSLIFSSGRWGVSWSPALIFPELANGNTLQLEVETPARANIYDREGDWLVAEGATTFTLQVLVGEVSPDYEDRMLDLLSQVLRTPPAEIKQNYTGLPDEWYIALGDIDAETMQANFSALNSYSALSWTEKTGRRYFDVLAPHVLGYTSLIPLEQLEYYQNQGYQGSEIVGLLGLESWGETYLAGTRGGTLNAFTSSGVFSSEVANRDPQPSQSLYTTIDRDLQAIVQDAIEDAYNFAAETWVPTAGGTSVVVIEVETGKVLAMASYPSFDPNVFHPNNAHPNATTEYFNALASNPRKPYLNRSTQGQYPPGSVFKIISAAAALDSGLFEADSLYTCTGIWTGLGTDEGSLRYDWKEDGHGQITLIQSLTSSCNPFYYQIGLTTAQEDFNILPAMANQFGLGAPLGIQIEEEGGQIPNPDWLWQSEGLEWTNADSVNMAIGQGATLVTPLQMATVVAAIANGGTVYQPQLVDRIGLIGEDPTITFDPVVLNILSLSSDQLAAIQEGMHGVPNDRVLGTAEYRLGSIQIDVAGKTGTAQVSQANAPPLAWFAGYVPFDEPEIAIIVMVENGGQGSGVASPIFRRIVERWYNLRVLPYPDDWADPDLFDFVSDEIGE